jgi:hypothetical protein
MLDPKGKSDEQLTTWARLMRPMDRIAKENCT